MGWWKKKRALATGSVLYRGALAPRGDNFAHLAELGMELREAECGPSQHWALRARHPSWGEAAIVCLRDAPAPPSVLLEQDPRLLPQERELAALGRSSVSISMELPGENLLRERKHLLRYLRALMGDDGVVAVDHTSQAFWSRGSLDEELSHDADLDILSLFTVHSVTAPTGEVFWLHCHGLQEVGYFDFDLLKPSSDLAGTTWDVLRALALAIVEGELEWGGPPLELMGGESGIRMVPAAEFRDSSGSIYPEWVAALDHSHVKGHAIACEPSRKLFGLFGGKPQPCKWLSGPLGDEDKPLRFSDSASELMSSRARATWSVLLRLREELASLELPTLIKIRYDTPRGGGEHLWFKADRCTPNGVEATLLSSPFSDIGIQVGDRRTHEIEDVSDWMMFTPLGLVSPRSTHVARALREDREGVQALMAAAAKQ